MSNGRQLAALLAAATVVLVVIGTVWLRHPRQPMPAGGAAGSSSTAEAAVGNLGDEIRAQAWEKPMPACQQGSVYPA